MPPTAATVFQMPSDRGMSLFLHLPVMLSQFFHLLAQRLDFSLFATVFRCRPLHQGYVAGKPDENGDDFSGLAAWLIASFRPVFSSSQRLRVAHIFAIIDMALLVSFHAALLSFGNASMMSLV